MSCAAALSWSDTRIPGDTRITPAEFLVLCNIAAGRVTRAEIAQASGLHESSVPRAVRRLVQIGALERTENPGKANSYVVKERSDTRSANNTGIATSRDESATRGAKGEGSADTRSPEDTPRGVAADTGKSAPHKEHAGARGLDNLLKVIPPEFHTDRVEPSPAQLARASSDRPPPPAYQRVAEAVNSPWLDPNKTPDLNTTGQLVAAWIRGGADEELDIIPTCKRMCARRTRPVTSWDWFTAAVREATAKRLRAEQIITFDEAEAHDQSSRNRQSTSNGRGNAGESLTEFMLRQCAPRDADDERRVDPRALGRPAL